jgi:hypothetical protein
VDNVQRVRTNNIASKAIGSGQIGLRENQIAELPVLADESTKQNHPVMISWPGRSAFSSHVEFTRLRRKGYMCFLVVSMSSNIEGSPLSASRILQTSFASFPRYDLLQECTASANARKLMLQCIPRITYRAVSTSIRLPAIPGAFKFLAVLELFDHTAATYPAVAMALPGSPQRALLKKGEGVPLNLHLTGRGLNRIESLPRLKDFNFMAARSHYRCSKFSACFLSQKAFRALCTHLTVPLVGIGNVSARLFEELFELMKGNEIAMADENLDEALKIGLELQNDELSTEISSKLFETKNR